MFFRIHSVNPRLDLATYRAKRTARLTLALYPMGPQEVLLSRYLKETYDITLKDACTAIINNATFNLNLEQEIIVTISNKKLNEIAKLITYGTGKIIGSHILKDIFTL